jgi:hypothetical protein
MSDENEQGDEVEEKPKKKAAKKNIATQRTCWYDGETPRIFEEGDEIPAKYKDTYTKKK